MKKIKWGIIGCGDVTEIKSGPAFNKVPDSALVAVMRRDVAKAADYARRHHVPRWYSDANQLIQDNEVNAIYIATPPSSHINYALMAIDAGKPVYVEKPMALNYTEAQEMATAAANKNVKLVVAHYRREWPLFKKLQQLIADNIIGEIQLANLQFYKPSQSPADLAIEKNAWRLNPKISGGGLFHDLAPHQLDIMYHIFGPVNKIYGLTVNRHDVKAADNIIAGNILFKNGIVFNGSWCFNTSTTKDQCELIGTNGTISFSFFSSNKITLANNNGCTEFNFEKLQHVQQPMIKKTVQYFLDKAPNPCTGQDGAEIMRWIDAITSSH
ncbi:MAG: Gfo/Idh/MocA family oxidoreductase [Ferruginibacter sp.]|nr:Gfo/Idh/MocA family oxidoreductase [Ferruginibacter sp.]